MFVGKSHDTHSQCTWCTGTVITHTPNLSFQNITIVILFQSGYSYWGCYDWDKKVIKPTKKG